MEHQMPQPQASFILGSVNADRFLNHDLFFLLRRAVTIDHYQVAFGVKARIRRWLLGVAVRISRLLPALAVTALVSVQLIHY